MFHISGSVCHTVLLFIISLDKMVYFQRKTSSLELNQDEMIKQVTTPKIYLRNSNFETSGLLEDHSYRRGAEELSGGD